MRSIGVAVLACLVVACGDTIVNLPVAPTTLPAGGVVAVTRTTVAFRAIGTPSSVRVRYSSAADGLAQIVTTLPWSGSFDTSADNLFLSLEGTPLQGSILTGSPFFAVQIIVNGNLFREATSSSFVFETLLVNGTWRR